MDITSPPSSHIADIDRSNLVMEDNGLAMLSLAGSDGMFNVLKYVVLIVLSSGSSTAGLLFICFCSLGGHRTLSKHLWCPYLGLRNGLRYHVGLQTSL